VVPVAQLECNDGLLSLINCCGATQGLSAWEVNITDFGHDPRIKSLCAGLDGLVGVHGSQSVPQCLDAGWSVLLGDTTFTGSLGWL
jgi:hypothetical protein